MDQQEEAEGAEEERLARIGGFTCQGRIEVLHDKVQWMDSLLSLLPPVQIHFGFQVQPKGFTSFTPAFLKSATFRVATVKS
jgi:hypothetical protein